MLHRPNKTLPPLNALRAFEAAARLQNLTRAARELHVTQGAVSQQIKLLEEYLDTPLFVRRGRRMELTDTARAYLPVLTEAFGNVLASTNELFVTDYRPTVRVKCGTSFAQRWLMARLPRFFRQYPAYRLRLLTSVWPSGQALEEADLEICHGYGEYAGLKVQRIVRERWIVVASPDFIDAHPQINDPEQLKTLPLLTTLGYREGWHSWFSELGDPEFQPAPLFESDNTSMALDMAIAGVGLLLGLSSNLRGALEQGLVQQAHPHTMDAEGGQYLVLPNRPITPKVNAFCQWLMAELAEHPDRDCLDW